MKLFRWELDPCSVQSVLPSPKNSSSFFIPTRHAYYEFARVLFEPHDCTSNSNNQWRNGEKDMGRVENWGRSIEKGEGQVGCARIFKAVLLWSFIKQTTITYTQYAQILRWKIKYTPCKTKICTNFRCTWKDIKNN